LDDLWIILYRSTETYEMDPADLLKLLLDARAHNVEHHITGLLLYHEHHFMQILEGPRDAVLALYQRISEDPRHRDLILDLSEPAQARLFPDWQMALAHVPTIRGRAVVTGIESERDIEAVLRTLSPHRPEARRLLHFLTGGPSHDLARV
jgi:hypothetical protein